MDSNPGQADTKTYVQKCHEENQHTFSSRLFESGGRSLACKMWDAMTINIEGENCLGENFNQLLHSINDEFFLAYSPTERTTIEAYFTTYILWLYLVAERVFFVLEIIDKDSKNKMLRDFREKNFGELAKIRRWANFIKHPKEFLFCHWPLFTVDNCPSTSGIRNAIIIDDKFVEDNYVKKVLYVPRVENSRSVIVIIPELKKLTEGFCAELNVFFNLVCDNKIISTFLQEKTTVSFTMNDEGNDSSTLVEEKIV